MRRGWGEWWALQGGRCKQCTATGSHASDSSLNQLRWMNVWARTDLSQDWFSSRGNPPLRTHAYPAGIITPPRLPANRHVSASYIRIRNPARCYLHPWYQGDLPTPPPHPTSLPNWSDWPTVTTFISPDWQAVSKVHSQPVRLVDGWMAPATPQRKRAEAEGQRSTWLSA